MPVDVEDVMRLLTSISEDANLRVTVKESLKGGVIAGCITAAGGLAAGPVGLAVGGTLGGLTAAYFGSGKFVSVGTVIQRMEPKQQTKLYNETMAIIDNLSCDDFASLSRIVSGDIVLRDRLVATVIDHVTNEMRMEILD